MTVSVVAADSPHLRSAGGPHHGAHDVPGHMRVSQTLCFFNE